MRTRTRTILPFYQKIDFLSPVYGTGDPDDQSWVGAPVLYEKGGNNDGGFEHIEDDPRHYDGEKECLQYRNLVVHRPLEKVKLGLHRYWGGTIPYREILYNTSQPHAWCLEMMPYFVGQGAPDSSMLPTLSDLHTDVSRRAFESVLPKVNDGLSVVNFLLELKDLRRMFDFKTLERAFNAIPTMRGKLNAILRDRKRRRGDRKKGENELTDLGDDFLNYSFGWKPFLGDLTKMYDALKNLDKKLDYLERNQGKTLRRHARVELEVDEDFSTAHQVWHDYIGYMTQYVGYASTYGMKGTVKRTNKFDYKPRYHMTVVYRYTIPKHMWQRTRNKIRGFLDVLGIRFDPSIIWNAIPFSFVLDWVIDVGGFLREFAPSDLGMHIEILDASHSLKWNYVGQFSASLPVYSGDPSAPLSHYVNLEVADVIKSYYERRRFIPYAATVAPRLPTGLQWTLGGALANSRNKGRFWRG